MVFILKKAKYSRLIGLLLLVSGLVSLNCTSAYHGPPRFSYENREGSGHDRFPRTTDSRDLKHRTSNPAETEAVTVLDNREYVLRRTANNLWYLTGKPPEDKPGTNHIRIGCCPAEQKPSDSTFCYNAINTFFEITEILVTLTGFNPVIRALLAASLKYLKPLLYLLCGRTDNRLFPSFPVSNRT